MTVARRSASFGRPLDAELIQVTNAAAQAPLGVPAAARAALMSVADESIMFRVDGTSPTSSVGHKVNDGDFIELGKPDLASLEVISISATQANVFITYYGD